MADANPVLSITLNVNGFNNPIKRQRLSDWILKKSIYILFNGDTL
jgi:hypothetical protein